ncbi:hypothetical protein C9374_008674 [Naegleria lovaniensis]|uniref:Short/branched chain specific acyl-CoA dehydrogenase, mitochondrial n=1 Tax=Naegleria lovaniensis TaxID=51637 RepID=A0AA88GEM4_NAELO|nr:uncharacterized protein C9374_008674 [Naegleria lovaniensis]KAG2378052.1 hypothetical protein C9374_008674 [Naegleria lovaniensis]
MLRRTTTSLASSCSSHSSCLSKKQSFVFSAISSLKQQEQHRLASSSQKSPLFDFTEDETMMKSLVQDFVKHNMPWELVHKMDVESKLDPALKDRLFEVGLMGIEIPEEYGGSGQSFTSSIIAIEELAKCDPAISVIVDVQNTLVNNLLSNFGTKQQKDKYLTLLASKGLGSFCLSEASSGSDAFALKTRADVKSDGSYVLNGTKCWITSSQEASFYIVMANTDFSKGYKGITAFLVDRENPGLKIGKKEDKLGIRASSTCEVILEDCVVGPDSILGGVGKGYKLAIETLNEGRIGIAAQMVGLAQGVFDYTIPYLKSRKQFNTAIADFQGMEFQYARAAVEIEAARLMVYNAARMKEAGQNFTKQAAMAKYYSSEVAGNVATKCIEWLGGVGFTKEFCAEKFYRDCIIGKIYEGTSNINLQTIAKFIKKEYN